MPYFTNNRPMNQKDMLVTLGTLFDAALGTYVYKAGVERKAISINKRPEGVSVTGLEIVIKGAPSANNRYQTWDFFVIDRDGGTQPFYQVVNALNCLVRRGGRVSVVAQTKDIGNFMQAFVAVPMGELIKLREQINAN